MELKDVFDSWVLSTQQQYREQQWLLSKWEVFEGIVWPEEKKDRMVRSISRRLQLNPSDTFVDLGCGGGWILNYLSPEVQWSLGVDVSYQMLTVARELSIHQPVVCAEMARLPFKTETVSKILCYFVLINVEEDEYVEKAILEIWRVLKQGGLALLGQLPDKDGAGLYDEAKINYLKHWEGKSVLGKNTSDQCHPPLRLFDKDKLTAFLDRMKIPFSLQPSFNPFYRDGEPEVIDWRFDVILEKKG